MSMNVNPATLPWYLQKRDGQVYKRQLEQAREIEWRQASTFTRFFRLECLYDPNVQGATRDSIAVVDENVVAGTVDTVSAVIASTDVRARFLTDGADWSTQRRARQLELYAEQLGKIYDVPGKSRGGFKAAAKKGTGLTKVCADYGELAVENVLVDDIIVDDLETENGCPPRSLHQVHRAVDKEDLKLLYPKFAEQIDRASTVATGIGTSRRTAGPGRPLNTNQCSVTESWALPFGTKGKPGYRAGRYVKTIDGADLVDVKYEKPFFPFARFVWSERERSWYGISLAERIAGHQRTLNRRNWHIQRLLDQNSAPTTYVRPADAAITTLSAGPLGTLAICKGDYPQTVMPPPVPPSVLQSRIDLKVSAYEESGVNAAMAQGSISPGLESGVAVREERHSQTQRFATQEKAYEQYVLDTVLLMMDACKDLGAAAPVVTRQSRFGTRKIKWSDVDMKDLRVQIAAASTLARTPAGRVQTVLEWAQAGVISMDEARRLMQHPDLERAMSLYTAALEAVEECLDEIEDGKIVMPEPFDNHAMCVWRGQSEYLIIRKSGAPEEILEGLRQFVVTGAWFIDQASAANQNATMAQPGALPMDPAAAAAGALPGAAPALPMGMPPPGGAPAIAALAPQAMQLRAG